MENRGLIFIPDISGFSRFVSEMEIEHSRLIIQELLEILIDVNYTGLEVSEVEGDAILFYKYGEKPSLEGLYSQVEKMFCAFHKNLIAYESRRYCQCRACLSAINLTLKIITHYGEFTGYNVKHFSKLIGKDIIIAHQLLKNDIAQHEYWLVTNDLSRDSRLTDLADWMNWNSSVKTTDQGDIPFHYTQLGPLKNKLSAEPTPKPDLSQKIKALSFTREYDTDIIKLFHATGNFNHRPKWMDEVKKVEIENHFLPRVGMRCRIILDNGEMTTCSSSYIYQNDRIEFSETDVKTKTLTYYILEKTSDQKTKLTLEYYIPDNPLSALAFNLFRKKKIKNSISRSLENLTPFVKELRILSNAEAI